MRIQNKICLLFALLTFGCAGEFTSKELSPGIYEARFVETTLPGGAGRTGAMRSLDLNSLDLCPAGYEKLAEKKVVDKAGVQTTIWTIKCLR